MAFSFEPTRDWDLIKAIIISPKIYEGLSDDFSPPPNEWRPTDHPSVMYVVLIEGSRLAGMIIVQKHSPILWEIHNAILPHVGWKSRVALAAEFFAWAWIKGCRRAIGKVSETNRYSLRFSETIGMERIGVNKRALMKGGILVDEIWFGLSKVG